MAHLLCKNSISFFMNETREELIQFLQQNIPLFKNETFEGYSIEVLNEMKRMVEIHTKAEEMSRKYAFADE